MCHLPLSVMETCNTYVKHRELHLWVEHQASEGLVMGAHIRLMHQEYNGVPPA